MKKSLIFNWLKYPSLFYPAFFISLLFLASACGDADYSSSETEETGSITFGIVWKDAPTMNDVSDSTVTRALNCTTTNVATVEGEIYDENDTYLAGGGPWDCDDHAGTIENVPAGSNRKVVVLGKDSSDKIIYQGEQTGIDVTADQTTDAGEITVSSAVPTNVTATAGDGQVTISWDAVSGATSYKIYWATGSGVSKTSYEGTTSPDTSINPDTTVFESVLSYNGNTYAVTKDDMLTWEEANTLSNQHDGYIVTINDAQENAFLTQNYLSVIYREFWIGYNDRDSEGTWVWANDETSTYTNWESGELNGDEDCVIIRDTEGYWDDAPCLWGRNAIVEWTGITSYTHTGLTNGTTYYYVITAVNNYGDESGESSEVNATPSSTPEWTTATIDSTGSVGSWNAIAVDSSNKVHISYFDATNQDLEYATNSSGSWVTSTITALGNIGNHNAIALDSTGKVHISYQDGGSNDTKYATNSSGSWVTSTIDSTGWKGRYTSIAIDSNNKVHMSYLYDITTSDGDLIYATNASGSWVTTTVDSPGNVGVWTSIAVDSGNNIHIAYMDWTNKDLKYATNSSGSWVTSTVDSTGWVGDFASIDLDSNDKAHIVYYDTTNTGLKYATNASGSWITSTIDSSGDVGKSADIALDSNGKAHISYHDSTNADLEYATNSSGSWVTSTVDSEGDLGDAGSITSMAVDSNNDLHISYYDATNGDLKYANW